MKLRTHQPVHDEITRHASGWWVPAQVGGSLERWLASAQAHVELALQHTAGRKVAVQAGGHIGAWPYYLARHFGEVITFEPDAINQKCLRHNCFTDRPADAGHIILSVCALSDQARRHPWYRSISNTGKHKLKPIRRANKGIIAGEVQTIMLDSLNLKACDLICLDIEGHELPALMGAAATIERYRPTVLIEELGHGANYGIAPGVVGQWLIGGGYRLAATIDDDQIWTAND